MSPQEKLAEIKARHVALASGNLRRDIEWLIQRVEMLEEAMQRSIEADRILRNA